ncbi:MAG: endolytic transglycosylase MltG [Chitinophagaceae bacterium]|jgi:UPF0755 protein|nr:endolytic transglycosylase MltG [Chitinophagaceae bacterium]
MKKLLVFAIISIVAILMAIAYFRFLSPATRFQGKERMIYIPSVDANRETVLSILAKDSIVKNPDHFDWLADKMKYWESIKPGRYAISKDMNVREIVFLLRSGRQTPVRLVINKLRLPKDLVKVLDRAIEADSASIMVFIQNRDSLKNFGVTDTSLFSNIIPDTYEVLWTWPVQKVLTKLLDERERWWNKNDRKAKADALGLTQDEVHILASIVEEETNKKDEKPTVASVYINRLKRGMPLQADPTVRFAMKDFTSNRVLYAHLKTPSPYNTYVNRGLPPGPICTPSPVTLDAVLNAPETDYIFFVANADLMGGHTFTTNLTDHNRAAKVYQDSLSAWLKRKAIKEKAKKDSMEKAGKNTDK